MEQQFKNVLNYYEEIIAEGDQGETFAAIQRVLIERPDYVSALKHLFWQEPDEDRKDILLTILEGYAIEAMVSDMQVKNLTWDHYKDAFVGDETWQDIYVADTDHSHWQKVLEYVKVCSGPYRFSHNGVESALPCRADSLFKELSSQGLHLSLKGVYVTIHCRFSSEGEITFKFDPREIKDEHAALEIFSFMATLGLLLERAVHLSPESLHDKPVFTFNPQGYRFDYHQ